MASDGENDSEDPNSALNPPIEALQGLANAAVEAANASELQPRYVDIYISILPDYLNGSRVHKRKKDESVPHHVFPHVVEKVRNALAQRFLGWFMLFLQGLVPETEARELFHMFAITSYIPLRS